MNHRSAIGLFIVISLALLLAIPTVNLSDRKIRQQVWALAMERDAVKLKEILFNRDWLDGLQSRAALPFGISTNPAAVIVGTGGWLFLGDQENRNTSAQRYGESDRDARIALEMGHNLLAWEAWLHAQGVRGVAWVVGPDKHRIYNQHLPKWIDLGRPARIRGFVDGPAKHLIADPTGALKSMSAGDAPPTYYPSDTHWNMWGAAVGMETLRSTLRRQGLDLNWALATPPAIASVDDRAGGDLARFLHTEDATRDPEPHPISLAPMPPQSDIREWGTDRVLQADAQGQLQYPGKIVRVITPDAANDLKVLWIRDSFGIAQSPLMAVNFKETVQVHWHAAFTEDAQLLIKLVQDQRPDLVVLTVVERVMPSRLFSTPPPKD